MSSLLCGTNDLRAEREAVMEDVMVKSANEPCMHSVNTCELIINVGFIGMSGRGKGHE